MRSRTASSTPRAALPPTRWWCARSTRPGSVICARRRDGCAGAAPGGRERRRSGALRGVPDRRGAAPRRAALSRMDGAVHRGRHLLGAVGAGQASPFDQASLFYDDRDLMRTRVERLEHPRIHVQTPPSRTAHLLGNVAVESADDAKGEYAVASTLIMVEYRDEQQRVFAGRQHHHLRREEGRLRIVRKRVDLINCDSAFEAMAVPI